MLAGSFQLGARSKLTVLMRTPSKTSETGRQTGVWNLLVENSKTVSEPPVTQTGVERLNIKMCWTLWLLCGFD